MSKKTVPVLEMLEFANESLAFKNHSIEFKEGICSMIEKILHKSGNYNGFMFLDQEEASVIFNAETKEYRANAAHVTRKYFSPKK